MSQRFALPGTAVRPSVCLWVPQVRGISRLPFGRLIASLLLLLTAAATGAQSTANYVFSTNTNGSLAVDLQGNTVDMSTGTTQLYGANVDSYTGVVQTLPFTFIFMGTPYTSWSANPDGQIRLGSTVISSHTQTPGSGVPLLIALNTDCRTGATGRVHFKINGSAPNRVLIVEWSGVQIPYNGSGTLVLSTFQTRLYETTGVVEYVYGAMQNTSTSAHSTSVAIASGSSAGTIGVVSAINTTPSYSSSATSFTSTSFAQNAAMANLNSSANGSRRFFRFTPSIIPNAPTALTASNVRLTSMTLSWTDNATNESGFALYRSTDGTNFTYVDRVAANTTSYAVSGLTQGTSYTWRVTALGEGQQSAAAQLAQATPAPITSAASGPWNEGSTWTNGVVPGCSDFVVIQNGHTVTVNASVAQAANLTINSGGSLTVSGSSLTVGCTNNNATLANSGALVVSGGALNVNGNMANASGSAFTQSGGTITVDGNNAGAVITSVASGTPLVAFGASGASFSTGTISMTGGTLTIVDPHTATSSTNGYALYGNLASGVHFYGSPNHTVQFGNGSSATTGGHSSGFFNDLFLGSGRLNLGSVTVNTGSASNRVVTMNSTTQAILGNLTVSSGTFDTNTGTLVLGGNIQVASGATLLARGSINFGTITSSTTVVAQTTPQSVSVSGTGSIQNLASSATANFTSIIITNTSSTGVTFGALNNLYTSYASFTGTSVSGSITFNGYGNTTAGAALVAGTVSGGLSGTITVTSGGMLPGSTYGRTWTTGQTGSTISSGTVPSSTAVLYPFVDAPSATASIRNVWLVRSSPTVAGITAITYTNGTGINDVSIPDGAYTVSAQFKGFWSVNTYGTSPDGTFSMAVSAPNALLATPLVANARITTASAVVGTHQAGTTLPHAQRTGLSRAQLTAQPFYIGIDKNDLPHASVQSGDWNSTSTWLKGVVPGCSDAVTISGGTTVTVNDNSPAAQCASLTINGGTLVLSGSTGQLTVGCTGNNNTLTNNGTLTLSGGRLIVNGNVSMPSTATAFNMSGGEFFIDPNSGVSGTSVATGTQVFAVDANIGGTVNGGTIVLVDPHFGAATAATLGFNTASSGLNRHWTGNTLVIGGEGYAGMTTNTTSSTRGFELDCFVNSARLQLGNVVVNSTGSGRFGASANATGNGTHITNLTVNAGGEFRNTTATGFCIAGNLTNNGTLTTLNTLTLGAVATAPATGIVASTLPQTIGGTGVFQNLTSNATASMAGLTVNNSNATGITLNVPLSVSGTLTLTSGLVNTTAANLLTLGTASAAGTLSGTPSATNMIVGPFARTFGTRTASGTYDNTTLFPVGKTAYTPLHADPTTTASLTIRGEAFATNSGTANTGISDLAATRWELATIAGFGNLTSSRLRVSAAGIQSNQSLVQAPSAGGLYDGISGISYAYAASPASLTTNAAISAATLTSEAFLSFATLTPCVVPANQATNLQAVPATTSITASFTAAADNPNGYLVVRYASGATPQAPLNGTVYAAGTSALGGTIVAVGSATNFSNSGLTANTAYDFYIYSFNNNNCSGIAYNTSSPLTATVSTCVVTPTASAATNNIGSGFTANWTAVAGATGYQLDVSTSSTFANFVTGFNSLAIPGGSTTSFAVTGLSPATLYYYRVRAAGANCASGNSSTTSITTFQVAPWVETFGTATTAPTSWTATSMTVGTLINGTGNSSMYYNLWSSGTSVTFTTPTIAQMPADAQLSFQYQVVNYLSTSTPAASGWGSFQLQVSTNGTSWTNLGSAVSATTPNGYATISHNLSAYTGQNVSFRISATWGAGDVYINFDNFNVLTPCVTPATPGGLVFGATGPGSIAATITPTTPAPTGYLVVRYPAGSTETAPVNGTGYNVGQGIGDGVVSNIVTSGTSFTASGLSPNSSYLFYVYPYNNTNCLNGPVFGTAVSGTQSTAGCPTLNPVITVGASGADYTSLTDVSLILNGCPVSSPTLVKLMADYNPAGETYPVTFNQNGGASATNTITVRPDDNVTLPFVLNGSTSGSTPMIDLSGARFMTFDGRAGGTGNTSLVTVDNSGSGPALRLFNDAQNNTITYLTLRASNTSAANGVVRLTAAAGTGASNGNSHNTISNCDIDGKGSSANGIYALGSTAPADNKSNQILNNRIFNFFSDVASTRNAGIQIGSGNGVSANAAWTLSDNHIYQTAARSYANLTGVHGINIEGSDGVFTISGNFVGGTQASAGGSAMSLSGTASYNFAALRIFPASSATTNVTGNTVRNITLSTASTSASLTYGIGVQQGQAVISGNTVGSTTTAGSISVSTGSGGAFIGIVGLNGSSSTGTTLAINNNTIAGLAATGSNAAQITGIHVFNATTMSGSSTINGNTIGASAAPLSNATNSGIAGIVKSNAAAFTITSNTISFLTSTNTGSSGQVIGISASGGANTIGAVGAGNTVSNLSSSAINVSTGSSASVIGINMTSGTTGQSITGNTVHTLVNSGNAAVVVTGIGMFGVTTGSNTVARNLVYGLAATHASATSSVLNGIAVTNGSTNFHNNIVRLGTVNPTLPNNISGINETGGTNNWYFNSVYIGGSGVGTTSNNTFALNSTNTGTRLFRNNVFQNARTNATTGGNHYAVQVAGSTAAPSGLTLSNNVYFTASAGGFLGRYNSANVASFADWRNATYASGRGPGLDAFSYSSNPNFTDPVATVPDLMPSTAVASVLESAGTPIAGITVDFAGTTRNATTPDIGAYEFAGAPAVPVLTLNSITPAGTQCTATSREVLVTVTPGATPITAGMVRLTYAFNGGTATVVDMTNTSGNRWSATIPAATPVNATVTWSVGVNDGTHTLNQSGASYADAPLAGATLVASVSTSAICAGATTALSASMTATGTAKVGTGTGFSSSSSSSGSAYPTWWGSGRQQYVFSASELTAAGLRAGNITSLSVLVQALGTPATLNGYTIAMGHVGQNTFASTAFFTGLTTVWGPQNYSPVVGVNTHQFSAPFTWNGTSAVVVEICYGNNTAGTSSHTMEFTSTTGNTVAIFTAGSGTATGCGQSAASLGTSRPNITFAGMTSRSINSLSWSDGTTTVGTTTPLTVSPAVTTAYTASGTDGNNCPISSNPVTVTVNSLPSAPLAVNSTQCGLGVPTASVTSTSGLANPAFNWYAAPTGGTPLQSGAATTYTAAISQTTTYYVSELNSNTGCESERTPVTITVQAADPVSAASGIVNCVNGQVSLTATQQGSTNQYNYAWTASPAAGSGIPTDSARGASVLVTPTVAGTYVYLVTATDSASNCVTTATVSVTVHARPAITTATATPSQVCPGATVGLAATSIGALAGTAAIGVQTTTATTAGSPYRASSTSEMRVQYLFTAAELQAAGLRAGNITSLAFNITSLGSNVALPAYTIRMGHSAATVLTSSFQAAPSQVVLGPISYTPVSGVNTHTFSAPFNWNGTSNILVQICHSGPGAATNHTVSMTAATNLQTNNTGATACTSASGTLASIRPVTTFGGQVQGNITNTLTWNWEPGTLAGASVTATAPAVPGVQTYTVTATDTRGCTQTATVDVNVGLPLSTTATAANPALCIGGSTSLTAAASGGGTPYSYSWSDGNAVIGTTATLNVTPTQTTTYTVSATDACGNLATQQVTVTVNPLPTATIAQGASVAECVISKQLDAQTNAATPAYQWLLNGSNISGATNASYTATANGTYAVRVTDGVTGCVGTSGNTALSLQMYPSAVTVSPNTETQMCLGDNLTISASAVLQNNPQLGQTILSENFDAGSAGWSVTNASWATASTNWSRRTAAVSGITINGTPFFMANSDAGSSGSKTRTRLESPVFSTVGYSDVRVAFQHFFRYNGTSSDTLASVEISTNGGATWESVPLRNFTTTRGSATVPLSDTASLPAQYLNQSNVKISFNYVASWAWYWSIDNIRVIGTRAADFSWSAPAQAGLPASAATPAAANSSIQITPTAAGNYSYAVTASINGNGCTVTDTVRIVVRSRSTAPTSLQSSATGPVCSGSAVTLTQSGGTLTEAAYWQWYRDAAFTQPVGGQLTSVNAQLQVNPVVNTTYYLRAEGGKAPCGSTVAAADSVRVMIAADATASISYAGSPLCRDTGMLRVTITGTQGGRFTASPAGLVIDSLTGTINGGASQPGTYTVTYTFTGPLACAVSTTFTQVVIRPAQFFNTVTSQMYCAGATVPAMNFGAVPGITYAWTNDNTNIGLAASGTGNIAAFTAGISSTTDQTARITVRAIGGTGCFVTPLVFAITVAPAPQLNAIPNQEVCAGQTTTAVNFTTAQGATLANWSTNNPGIGVVASVTNSPGIPSFIARNPSGDLSTVATFTVTPVRRGCSGTPVQFTITVRNSATSLSYPQSTYCQNTGALPILRAGAGGTFSATPAGLTIDANTGRLNLWTSLAGTYTVTYAIENAPGGCGSSVSTQVTVLPRATVTPSVSVVGVCRGGVFPEISFTGTGTAYNWTNSNTAIGLAASGSGNIASFVGLNATATVQRATVTVTAIGNGTTTCNSQPTPIYLGVHTCNAATVTQAGGTGGDASTLRTQDVTLSPVPARNTVTVTYQGTMDGPLTVQMVSQWGSSLMRPAQMTTNTHTLDVSGLTPGTYVVQVVNPRTGQSVQKQLIKL